MKPQLDDELYWRKSDLEAWMAKQLDNGPSAQDALNEVFDALEEAEEKLTELKDHVMHALLFIAATNKERKTRKAR